MSDMLGEETFRKGLKRYLDARYVKTERNDQLLRNYSLLDRILVY